MHARAARLTALGLMLSVFACRDSVAPGKHAASASGSSEVVESGFVVHVSPDSSREWMFFDDQHGAACLEADNCHIARDTSALHFAETSIELATPTAADGDVLMLPAYRGVRLDRITELRYSTYRESPDSGDRLAVMLQLNVDYDLGDAYTAYEGRIVFEPAQGQHGAVPMGQWQRWDARAGRWWSTKTVVRRGGVETLGACTKASPCSWSQLLAAYPNIGIHAANGAIVLEAGANWAGFRGNTDSLAVGVNGVVTTYDFGRVFPVTEPPHLSARIGDGVVSATRLVEDTVYTPGARVAYSFTARPGHDEVMVVVDDTMAAPTGVIVMDQSHTIEVVSDTLYTIEGLSDDGKAIVAKIRTLLSSDDKPYAYSDILTYLNTRLDEGADGDQLTRDNAIAWHLAIDFDRDSAALVAVDRALEGYVFSSNGSSPFVEAWKIGNPRPGGYSSSPGGAQWSTPDASTSAEGPQRVLTVPEQLTIPKEATVFVYINGVFNWPGDAEATKARLRQLVRGQPRWRVEWVRVDNVYNARFEVQLAGYDISQPCVKLAWRESPYHSALFIAYKYAACNNTTLVKAFTTFDLVAAFTARLELLTHLPPSSPDVLRLAEYVKGVRTDAPGAEHVILVGHSEGTIVIPQALRILPGMEGHPLNDAKACLASLSLAGAANKSSYDLDDEFKSGFIVEGDAIRIVQATGWDIVHTGATEYAQSIVDKTKILGMPTPSTVWVRVHESIRLHSVDKVYLSDPTARHEIVTRLTALHKECTQADLTVTPTEVTAEAGTVFKVAPKVINQNGRELFGRWMGYMGNGSLVQVDSNTFLVTEPIEHSLLRPFTGVAYADVNVTTPAVPLVGTTITESYSSYWEFFASSNAGLGDAPYGFEDKIPTNDPWDGSDGGCTKYFTAYGRVGPAGTSYMTWVRRCSRTYHVSPGTATNPFVESRVVGHEYIWYYTAGGQSTKGHEDSFACPGPERCVSGVEDFAYTAMLVDAAKSGFVAAASGGSGVRGAGPPTIGVGQLSARPLLTPIPFRGRRDRRVQPR